MQDTHDLYHRAMLAAMVAQRHGLSSAADTLFRAAERLPLGAPDLARAVNDASPADSPSRRGDGTHKPPVEAGRFVAPARLVR